MTRPWPDDDVILYDGVCVFCSRWIRFVAARDAVYNLVARNRCRIFGKYDVCFVPAAEFRARVIE
jgi:predicted DCC family thiol-disulfide oxidoreductase YuxK